MEQETEGSHAGQALVRELVLRRAFLGQEVPNGETHEGSARLISAEACEGGEGGEGGVAKRNRWLLTQLSGRIPGIMILQLLRWTGRNEHVGWLENTACCCRL